MIETNFKNEKAYNEFFKTAKVVDQAYIDMDANDDQESYIKYAQIFENEGYCYKITWKFEYGDNGYDRDAEEFDYDFDEIFKVERTFIVEV